jgi:hypothetical protein
MLVQHPSAQVRCCRLTLACTTDKIFACERPQPSKAISHLLHPLFGISGAWQLTENYVYFLDRGLLEAMVNLVDGGSVLEFGAGKGCYTAAFRRRNVPTRAFDGSPQVAALTRGLVQSSDLTVPLSLGAADWVVCLEVPEFAALHLTPYMSSPPLSR